MFPAELLVSESKQEPGKGVKRKSKGNLRKEMMLSKLINRLKSTVKPEKKVAEKQKQAEAAAESGDEQPGPAGAPLQEEEEDDVVYDDDFDDDAEFEEQGHGFEDDDDQPGDDY